MRRREAVVLGGEPPQIDQRLCRLGVGGFGYELRGVHDGSHGLGQSGRNGRNRLEASRFGTCSFRSRGVGGQRL